MKMTSRFALVAAAGMLFGVASSANAADLGGGCCADLEERVAELEATTARKGNRVVSLQVYGSVNQEILYYDGEADGDDVDDLVITDDETSRFGFRGSATLRPGFTAGYRLEFATDGEQGTSVDIRQNNVWIESEQLGRLTIGNQSVATDGVANISLGNVYSDSGFSYEGILQSSGLDIDFSNFDGGREDAIRYDSPSIAGFILSAAWTNDVDGTGDDFDSDEYWDVALRYSGEFNAFRVAAAIGYAEEEVGAGEEETTIGSVSVMHVPTGIFGAFQGGEQENVSGFTDDFWYVQLGIEKQWLSYGATTAYGEYGEFDDAGGDDVDYWGLGFTQSFDAAAMDMYVLYRDIESDTGDEVQTLTLGTKINF